MIKFVPPTLEELAARGVGVVEKPPAPAEEIETIPQQKATPDTAPVNRKPVKAKAK